MEDRVEFFNEVCEWFNEDDQCICQKPLSKEEHELLPIPISIFGSINHFYYNKDRELYFYCIENSDLWNYIEVEVNYCPICGRKLRMEIEEQV